MGEPGDRLPLLCLYSDLVGRVCFTIDFTVGSSAKQGGGEERDVNMGPIRIWDP